MRILLFLIIWNLVVDQALDQLNGHSRALRNLVVDQALDQLTLYNHKSHKNSINKILPYTMYIQTLYTWQPITLLWTILVIIPILSIIQGYRLAYNLIYVVTATIK